MPELEGTRFIPEEDLQSITKHHAPDDLQSRRFELVHPSWLPSYVAA